MVSSRVLILTALLSLVEAQRVSTTGRCGRDFGLSCTGSRFGNCCSSRNWCGIMIDHCGQGCQSGYGTCGSNPSNPGNPSTKPVSTDARCGSQYKNQTCQGSAFGSCCSTYGYCGSTTPYCAANTCQSEYGTCSGSQPPQPSGNTLSTSVVPSRPSVSPTVTITVGAGTTCAREETTVTIPTTVTLPGEDIETTVTIPTTVTLPGEDIETTVTIPTTVTLPGEDIETTVTVTASAVPSAPAGYLCSAQSGVNVIKNGGFEQGLPGTWRPFQAGPDAIIIRTPASPASGSFSFRSRAGPNTGNNTPQRLAQPVLLCPGVTYELTFKARTTVPGAAVVAGWIEVPGEGGYPLAGGALNSDQYVTFTSIDTRPFPLSGTAPVPGIFFFEFSYGGDPNVEKDIYVDDVVLAPV